MQLRVTIHQNMTAEHCLHFLLKKSEFRKEFFRELLNFNFIKIIHCITVMYHLPCQASAWTERRLLKFIDGTQPASHYADFTLSPYKRDTHSMFNCRTTKCCEAKLKCSNSTNRLYE